MNITKHILIASIASIAFILIIAICSAVYFSIFSIIKSSSSIEGFANKYFDKKKEFFGCGISLLDYSNDMKFYSCLNDDSVKIVREFYEDFVKELKNRYNVENLNIREKHIYYTILFDATMQLEFFEQELPRYMPSVIAYDDCLFGTIINQGSGDGTHVFKTIDDYEDWNDKLLFLAQYLNDSIDNLKQGINKKATYTKYWTQETIRLLNEIRTEDVEDSILYAPIKMLQANNYIEDKEKEKIIQLYKNTLLQRVFPSFKKMESFLQDEYLPFALEDTGLWQYGKMGDDYYNFTLKWIAETDMTSSELHDLGLKLVDDVNKRIDAFQNQLKFNGTRREFWKYLNDNPSLKFNSAEDVVDYLETRKAIVNDNIHKLFSKTPEMPLDIVAVTGYRAKLISPYYQAGSVKQNTSGVFFIPITEESLSANNWLDDLFLHEGIPGHHYQSALQMENKEVPELLSRLNFFPMLEGWALYAESLGKELGLYTSNTEYAGFLQSDMLRSMRLVMDTGLHAKQWSMDKSIKYFDDNLPFLDPSISVSESARYIIIPGQAISYKIGQKKILDMKSKYKAILGDNFDIKKFHDALIINGNAPLSFWEEIVGHYLIK